MNVGALRTRLSAREELPARTRRRLRLVRTAVIVVLIVAGIALLNSSRSGPANVGEPPVAAAPEPAPPARAPDPGPAMRAVPVHIRVASIGVDAELVQVGILEDDVMEVPDDVRTIGWYDPEPDPATGAGLGVIPGLQGTAVLAGHVDSRTQGRGALYDLRELAVGDTIEVDHADGSSTVWQVTDVIRYPKATLPYHEVFTWAGPPRLALITCGGEFDRTARSYTDNIVAYAVPLDGSAGSASSA
jgi:hypothetical protein